jgi:hypothetical protein
MDDLPQQVDVVEIAHSVVAAALSVKRKLRGIWKKADETISGRLAPYINRVLSPTSQ